MRTFHDTRSTSTKARKSSGSQYPQSIRCHHSLKPQPQTNEAAQIWHAQHPNSDSVRHDDISRPTYLPLLNIETHSELRDKLTMSRTRHYLIHSVFRHRARLDPCSITPMSMPNPTPGVSLCNLPPTPSLIPDLEWSL